MARDVSDRTEKHRGDSEAPYRFHEADEEWDERKRVVLSHGSQRIDYGLARIRIVEPFWSSVGEEFEYLHAIEETRGMLPSERLEAIRRRFGSGGVKRMPRTRMSQRERDRQLNSLREQADEEWWQK